MHSMYHQQFVVYRYYDGEVVAKKWISLLIEFMFSRYLFVDVPVTSTFSESCTPNGTFWEFSH